MSLNVYQLKEAITRVPPNHVGEPLMKKSLGPVHLVNTETLRTNARNQWLTICHSMTLCFSRKRLKL